MSLLDTASLIVTPNGYKEGKLYSVIPSDGSGDLSVTRATTATRVNSAGLVELVPYNLFTYSEQLDNADWNIFQNGTIVTANTATAPNGTTTADRLVGTGGAWYRSQNISVLSGNSYTISIYVKSNTGSNQTFSLFGCGSISSGNLTATTEWQRFEFTFTANSGTLHGITRDSSNNDADLIVWGAQLVEGSTAKDYQKTETRLNIPRLDYSNGTCPSLLVEPQRTNLVLNSEDFSAVSWINFQTSETPNDTIAPNGLNTADRMTQTLAGGGSIYVAAVTLSGSSTASCYFKAGTTSIVNIDSNGTGGYWGASFNLSTLAITYFGSGTNGKIESVGNGWYRCSVSATITGVGYLAFGIGGNINDYIYVWGAQLEAGSYATSYIPTTSASVTRNADVISKTGISSLIGQTEGAVFIDLNIDSSFAQNDMRFINVGDGTAANWYFIGTNASNQIRFYYRTSNTAYVSFTTTLTNGRHKLAYAYANGDYVAYVDGTLVHSDNTIVVGSASQLNLGNDFGNFSPSKQFINAAALWKTRLTNTQLAQLTTI